MIDPFTVEKILSAADILDVIGDFVSLRRRGQNYVGLCPFHGEKTPSFTVSQAKGIYKCFGCGKGGNAANFIMEHEHLTYPEALRYLAKKYHIDVEERELTTEEKQLNSERESLSVLNEYAAKYFVDTLLHSDEGVNIGLSYFRERGLTDAAIATFRLGYCLQSHDAFTNQALSAGYKREFLQQTGLSIFKEDYYFDRFAGRVMFPIFGLSGAVIGFGGRVLATDKDKKIAKYVNSPESAIYSKSKTLYGLFQAKNEIVRQKKCLLVEGYLDVISLHIVGIKNVVASSGTSLTVDQIRLIHRFTNDITILYDGDAAGIKASLRGIDMIIEQGINVRIVLFPPGDDPDSYAQNHGSTATSEYIAQNETDFITFKTKLLKDETQNDPIKRAGLVNDIVRTIALIDDNVMQSVYIKECSRMLGVDENALHAEIVKIIRNRIKEKNKREAYAQPEVHHAAIPAMPAFVDNIYFEGQEVEIIRLLLLYGNHQIAVDTESGQLKTTVANYVIDQLRNDDLEMKNILNQKIIFLAEAMINKGEPLDVNVFTHHNDPEVSRLSAKLCSSTLELSRLWERRGSATFSEEKKLTEILTDLFIKYKTNIVREAKRNLDKELAAAVSVGDEQKIAEITSKITNINEIKQKLSQMQGRVIL